MLDLQEIENTIIQLENTELTFDSCKKLASLYILRDYANKQTPEVSHESSGVLKELNDIIPQYQVYCNVKRDYQLNKVAESAVLQSLHEVCIEVKEFITTLYSSTDMKEERTEIEDTLKYLYNKHTQ